MLKLRRVLYRYPDINRTLVLEDEPIEDEPIEDEHIGGEPFDFDRDVVEAMFPDFYA